VVGGHILGGNTVIKKPNKLQTKTQDAYSERRRDDKNCSTGREKQQSASERVNEWEIAPQQQDWIQKIQEGGVRDQFGGQPLRGLVQPRRHLAKPLHVVRY